MDAVLGLLRLRNLLKKNMRPITLGRHKDDIRLMLPPNVNVPKSGGPELS
jgi:hypothetical protein